MVDDSGSLPPLGNTGNYDASDIPNQSRMSPLSQADDDDEEDDTVAAGAVAVRPRYLLLGCGIAATVVVAFAALAVTVAVGIRPAARQVAMAQPQQHPMPTFLPLPTNVVAAAGNAKPRNGPDRRASSGRRQGRWRRTFTGRIGSRVGGSGRSTAGGRLRHRRAGRASATTNPQLPSHQPARNLQYRR